MEVAMKRFSYILTAMTIILALSACGSGEASKPDTSETTSQSPTENQSTGTQEQSEPDAAESPAWAEHQALIGSDDLCAVAYIGWLDDDFGGLDAYLSEISIDDGFGYISEIPDERLIEAGGGELYLIIPRADVDKISVNEWVIDESNDFTGAAGKELYTSDIPEPILIKCNISDIMPNTVINISCGGKHLSHSLSISLKDGSVTLPENAPGITDLTVYEFPVE